MTVIAKFVLFLAAFSLCSAKIKFLSDDFIASINAKQSTWIAGRNFPDDTPPEKLKRLAGSIRPSSNEKIPLKLHNVVPETIPDTFDGRTYWSQCESLRDVRDQGNCGSCWAFAGVEAITDRICIASNGAVKFKASAEDVLTCCGDGLCGNCDGGTISGTWQYWVNSGLVSGGDYGSNEGCQPYQSDPFNDNVTPACSKTCLNGNYGKAYSEDKNYGRSHYRVSNDAAQIQIEIMQNGPVEVHMMVYDDFYSYKSGVYIHTSGEESGGHAVKIIGWGTENGRPYWLVANSWGNGWSDLGGFFKILRGENHCDIETYVYGGEPM